MRLHCVRSCVADLRVDKQQSPPRMTREIELADEFNDEVVLFICCCRKFGVVENLPAGKISVQLSPEQNIL